MHNKPVVLVTGANKGIGLQIAKELTGHGFTVLFGSRDIEAGRAAVENVDGNAHAIQLDVTDPKSVGAAAEQIRTEFGRLDVLVNNAGISHAKAANTPFDEVMRSDPLTIASLDDIRAVWDVNVFGVISMIQAMLPLLRQAPAACIVTIGSSGGSLQASADPSNPNPAMFGNYTASKTAAHAATLAFALALAPEGIKVNIVCPGYTATDLTGFTGHRTTEQGARRAVELVLLGTKSPTATFSDEDGPVAW